MTNHAALQQEDKRWKRHASLRHEVLEYLSLYGPKNRERLYAGFDEIPTGEIAPVLDELRQLGYVEIGAVTDTVSVTKSGRTWLKSETHSDSVSDGQRDSHKKR